MSLQVLREEDRLRLRLDRPEARNALNNATLHALLTALGEAPRDARLRCIVLEGAGGAAFCAGVDLVERRTLDVDGMGRQSRLVLDVVRAVSFSPLPVIAAIDGWCLGAGLEVALACDLRIASEASRFGFPEMALGTYPGAGGAVLLPRVVGHARATELLMSTRRLDAAQALHMGLVHAVAAGAGLAGAVDAAVADLRKMSTSALRALKESLRRSVVLPLEDAFEMDQGLRRPLDASPEHREALQRAARR